MLKFDFFFTVNRSLAANTILHCQLNIVPQPAELLFLQTLFPVLQALFTSRSGKLIAFYNILVARHVFLTQYSPALFKLESNERAADSLAYK